MLMNRKTLLFLFLGLIIVLTGCGRIKRKLSGGSSPKPPPMHPFYTYTGFADWYRLPLKYLVYNNNRQLKTVVEN